MEHPTSQKQTAATPHLNRREEFEAALKNYRVSPDGLAVLQETRFTVIVGPTAVGRNTLINEMLKTGHYYFIISDTTRPPRQNHGVWEQDGVEYFFRKEDDMLEEIKAGLFLEAEIIHKQQVSGISIREIQKAHDADKIAITDVDIEGGINVALLKPDASVIYLVPPSFDEWLKRLHGRTVVTKDELRNRLEGAIKTFRLALENEQHFTFIVNHDKSESVGVLDELVRLGKHHGADEQAARELVRKLWEETEAYLKQL